MDEPEPDAGGGVEDLRAPSGRTGPAARPSLDSQHVDPDWNAETTDDD